MKLKSAEILREIEIEAPSSKLKTGFFNTLYYLNGSKDERKVKWRHVLINAMIEEAQLLSLFFIEGSILDTKAYTSTVMRVLCMLRLDYLFIYLGLYVYVLYILFSMSLMAILALGYLFYLACESRMVILKNWHAMLLKVLVPAMSVTLRIPITCITVLTLKYNSEEFSPEYGVTLEGYTSLFKAIVLFVWVIHAVISVVHETSSLEIRHYMRFRNFRAKSSQQPENWRILSIYCMCSLHFAFDNNSWLVTCMLVMLIFIVPLCRFLYGLPYYTMRVNFLYISCSLLMILTAFAHIMAVWFEDPNYVTVIFLFLCPLACILFYHLFVSVRRRLTLPQNITSENYELYLRDYFTEGKIEPVLKARLKTVRNFDTFYYIWKAYYYIGKHKKPIKARRVLHKLTVDKPSWTKEYQVMRCRTMIEEESYEENYRFIDTYNMASRNFEDDISLTLCTSDIWKELLSKSPSERNLRELIEKNIQLTETCKKQYRGILKAYPNNIDLMLLYGTFLCETCCEIKDGDHYISKAMNVADTDARSHNMSPFALGNSVILFKLDSDEEMIILSANYRARGILSYMDNELNSQSINALLLPYMAEKHKKAVNKELSQYPLYFLRDSEDHVRMIQAEYTLDYYKEDVYLTMVFKENDDGLPANVILDEQGTILGVTYEFESRTSMKNLRGKVFMDVFPGTDAVLHDHYNLLTIHKNFKIFAKFSLVDGEGYIIVSLISKEIEELSIVRAGLNNLAECSKFSIEDMFGFAVENEKEDSVADFYENHNFRHESSGDKKPIRKTMVNTTTQSYVSNSTVDSSASENIYLKRSRDIEVAFNKIFCSVTGIYILTISLISGILIFYTTNLNHVSLMLKYFSALSDSSLGITMSGQLVRLIDLRSKGLVLSEDINDDLFYYYMLMEDSSGEITKMLDSSYSESLKAAFRQEDVSVWSLEGEEVVRRSKNLIQISEEFRQVLLQVNENLDSSQTLDLPSMFFIYLNSHSEFLEKTQETTRLHREETTYYFEALTATRTSIIIVLAVFHMLGTLVIVYKLSSVQKISDNLWSRLINMNESSIRAKMENMRERLERFSYELEDDYVNAKKQPSKLNPKKVWVNILLVIVFNSVLSLVSIVLIEVLFLGSYNNICVATEEFLDTMSAGTVNTPLAWEYTMEYNLLDSDLSIYETVRKHNPNPNVEQSMILHTERINEFTDEILAFFKSSDLKPLATIQDSYLGVKEIYPEIYRDSYTCIMNMNDLRSFRSKDTTQADLMLSYEVSKILMQSQTFMISKSIDLIVQEFDRQKTWAVSLVSVNILLTIVYSLAFIRPAILKSKASINVLSEFIKINKIHNRPNT